MNSFRIKNLTRVALAAVIICVASWISIPFAVPFTMQTFAVFFALSLLGAKRGSIAIIVYLLIGLVGLPVYAGFRSGLGTLFGPTGGYLFGFLAIGLISMIGEALTHRPAGGFLSLMLGLFVCYALGTVWFVRISGERTFVAALSLCVFPYILPDLCKLALATFIAGRLRPTILK